MRNPMCKVILAVCFLCPIFAFADASSETQSKPAAQDDQQPALPSREPVQAQLDDPCVTQRNTVEMEQCGKTQFAQAEKELNQAYQVLLKKLSLPDEADLKYSLVKKQLVTAQRAWLTFRENDCKALETYNAGGSIRSIAYLNCMVNHTEERTKDLQEFIPGGL